MLKLGIVPMCSRHYHCFALQSVILTLLAYLNTHMMTRLHHHMDPVLNQYYQASIEGPT